MAVQIHSNWDYYRDFCSTQECCAQCLQTAGKATGLIMKVVRKCRAAAQEAALLLTAVAQRDATIHEQVKQLAVCQKRLQALAAGKLSDCVS